MQAVTLHSMRDHKLPTGTCIRPPWTRQGDEGRRGRTNRSEGLTVALSLPAEADQRVARITLCKCVNTSLQALDIELFPACRGHHGRGRNGAGRASE